MSTWIDFTRRGGPVCDKCVLFLEHELQECEGEVLKRESDIAQYVAEICDLKREIEVLKIFIADLQSELKEKQDGPRNG